MERRDNSRNARHLPVRFWRRGETAHLTGYTTNISPTGMFVASNQVLPTGTRVRVEVGTGRDSFVVEGVVARSIRSTPELSRLRLSGMGVRIMGIEDLIAEVVPAARAPRAVAPPPVPSTVERPPAEPVAPSTPEHEIYNLSFASIAAFRTAFERDIATGGVFVPCREPADLREVVTIEIDVEGLDVDPVRVEARVVQRLAPTLDDSSALMAGMGVEFVDAARALRLLRNLAGEAAIAELDRRGA